MPIQRIALAIIRDYPHWYHTPQYIHVWNVECIRLQICQNTFALICEINIWFIKQKNQVVETQFSLLRMYSTIYIKTMSQFSDEGDVSHSLKNRPE